MRVGNKVAVHLMFLQMMVGTGPALRCFTVVVPAASEKNVPAFFFFF